MSKKVNDFKFRWFQELQPQTSPKIFLLGSKAAGQTWTQTTVRPRRSDAGSAPPSHWNNCRRLSAASKGATTCRCWSGTPSPRRCASPRLKWRSGSRTDALSGRRSDRMGKSKRSRNSVFQCSPKPLHPSPVLLSTTSCSSSSARRFRCLRTCRRYRITTTTDDVWIRFWKNQEQDGEGQSFPASSFIKQMALYVKKTGVSNLEQ